MMKMYLQDGKLRAVLKMRQLIEYMTLQDLDAGWQFVTPHIALKTYNRQPLAAIRLNGLRDKWRILREVTA